MEDYHREGYDSGVQDERSRILEILDSVILAAHHMTTVKGVKGLLDDLRSDIDYGTQLLPFDGEE